MMDLLFIGAIPYRPKPGKDNEWHLMFGNPDGAVEKQQHLLGIPP